MSELEYTGACDTGEFMRQRVIHKKDMESKRVSMKKRKGIIKISAEFIRDDSEILLSVFGKFIPIKIDYDDFKQEFTYLGRSPLFDEIEEVAPYPEYLVVITSKQDGSVEKVEFKRASL